MTNPHQHLKIYDDNNSSSDDEQEDESVEDIEFLQ